MLRSICWVREVEGVYVSQIAVFVLTSDVQTRFRAGGASCERNTMRSMVFLGIVWRIDLEQARSWPYNVYWSPNLRGLRWVSVVLR
jgi:hypothetical protein